MMLSPGLSSLEMDSNTSMSAPSPASVSMDGTMSSLTPPPQNGKDSSNSGLDVRVLQHRVRKTTPPVAKPKYSSFTNKLTTKVHVLSSVSLPPYSAQGPLCVLIRHLSVYSLAFRMTCHSNSSTAAMASRIH